MRSQALEIHGKLAVNHDRFRKHVSNSVANTGSMRNPLETMLFSDFKNAIGSIEAEYASDAHPGRLRSEVITHSILSVWMETKQEYQFRKAVASDILSTDFPNGTPASVLDHAPFSSLFITNPLVFIEPGLPRGWFVLREKMELIILSAPQSMNPNDSKLWMLDINPGGLLQDWNLILNGQSELRWALSLYLYLCSYKADMGMPVSVGNGSHATGSVTEVGVSYGMGRNAYYDDIFNGNNVTRKMRGHNRCAHWHTFLYGRGRVLRKVKWMPPTPINGGNRTFSVKVK
jgi:hypothetical protein